MLGVFISGNRAFNYLKLRTTLLLYLCIVNRIFSCEIYIIFLSFQASRVWNVRRGEAGGRRRRGRTDPPSPPPPPAPARRSAGSGRRRRLWPAAPLTLGWWFGLRTGGIYLGSARAQTGPGSRTFLFLTSLFLNSFLLNYISKLSIFTHSKRSLSTLSLSKLSLSKLYLSEL